MRNVDEACRQIKEKETTINLSFITIGTLISRKGNEGIYYMTVVTYFARVCLIQNPVPLMRSAPFLRRVVTVFEGTKEGMGIKMMMTLYSIVEPFATMTLEEAGERQVFFATSERFRGCGQGIDGVPTKAGGMMRAVDGLQGKIGVYPVGSDGEPASKQVVELLTKMRDDGVLEKVWSYTESELGRIT
ncbi:hypothetical protein B0T18DRAFT_470304, partial [Schizothecium vesticola]